MTAHSSFNSNLSGLIKIYVVNDDSSLEKPGAAYFEFDNYQDIEVACKKASKSWELFCAKTVPINTEPEKCFGFSVRKEEKTAAKIEDMPTLIGRINYWMGGTSNKEENEIPVINIGLKELKDRTWKVPQKNYDYLKYYGLKLAIQDPYQE
ncbi:MAG: hypothetical protein K1000chlam3_00403 [Chlamydiae bacterium]|nr:hypothetical protein [Chlamydiota bacterium]